MSAYADLADLPESDRIDMIGKTVASGHTIAFIIEDDAKADRYLAALRARFKVRSDRKEAARTDRTALA